MLSVLEIIKRTTGFFEQRGVESPRLNAELLIGHALGLKRMQLYLQFERPLTEPELEKIRPLVKRRGQIGTGGRSERIRTYNFPQNRMTDHRIGLTLYSLPAIMEGGLDPVIEALQRADFEEKLAALTGGPLPVRARASDED